MIRFCRIFIIVVMNIYALRASDSFNVAVQKHIDGQIEEAITLYLELESEGNTSRELYANLGRAYYEMGSYGMSRLYYERLLKHYGYDRKSSSVIADIENKTEISLSNIPDFFVISAIKRLALTFNAMIWIVFQIVMVGALIWVMFEYLIRKKQSFRQVLIAASLVVAVLIVIGLGRLHHQLYFIDRHAVVIEERTQLYNAADERSGVVTPLAEGMKVYIIDELSEWFKIRLSDKDEGWVKKERVKII